MAFEVRTREIGPVVVIEAQGRFTWPDGCSQLRDLIHVLTAKGARKFVIHLAHVEFIDSYGVGELARCYSAIRQVGGAMKLADVNGKVLDLLAMSQLNRIFDIYPGEEAAFKAFGHRDSND